MPVTGGAPYAKKRTSSSALVARLHRRVAVHGGEVARLQVDPLRRLAEEHRQRAAQAHEHLFLAVVHVPPPARVRRIAPEAGARVGQVRRHGHVGREPRLLPFVSRPLFVGGAVGAHDVEAHAPDDTLRGRGQAVVSPDGRAAAGGAAAGRAHGRPARRGVDPPLRPALLEHHPARPRLRRRRPGEPPPERLRPDARPVGVRAAVRRRVRARLRDRAAGAAFTPGVRERLPRGADRVRAVSGARAPVHPAGRRVLRADRPRRPGGARGGARRPRRAPPRRSSSAGPTPSTPSRAWRRSRSSSA